MSHEHGAGGQSRVRLAVALGIATLILIAEIVGTAITGSLSLLVDAGHMLTDAGGLTIALVAATLVARPATPSLTWGYRRAEVLAALAQAAVLLAVGIYGLVQGIERLFAPPAVPSGDLLVFGLIGLVGNMVSIGILTSRRHESLNLRAAFLEVVNDALGSVAVIVAAIVIGATGWLQADAAAGILISLLIVPRTVALLRDTTGVLLEATPRGLDLDAVREHVLQLQHVRGVHDLHASQIATGLPILSAHVVVEKGCFEDGHAPRILDDLQACVLEHFSVAIEHSTFQLEPEAHAEHEHVDHV